MLSLGIVGFVLINIVLAGILLRVSSAIGRGHTAVATANLSNKPPVLGLPLQDLRVPAGQASQLQLDADTFVDTDIGDALKYQAYLFYSARLPAWIKFDGLNRQFEFHPPGNASGSLRIRVVARDFDGLEAEESFTLSWGDRKTG